MDQTNLEEIFEVTSIEDGLDHDLEELEMTLDNLNEDEITLYEMAPTLRWNILLKIYWEFFLCTWLLPATSFNS